MSDLASRDVEKLETASLRERVYDQLKSLILSNSLLPGQQIVIDQLARQMGVSHTPIREALAMLELEGLVVMTHYKNARVSKIDADDVREVYEMRRILEGWAAGVAALSFSNQEIQDLVKLKQIFCQQENKENFKALLDADILLHDLIINQIDNRLFSRISELVNLQSRRIRTLVEAIQGVKHADTRNQEHCDIVDAITSRDPVRARSDMELHLVNAQQRTISALEEIKETE